MISDAVNPERISQTYALIRPRIRRTPVVEVDPADFSLPNFHLTFKLELLQHAGSFKTRGAFANLLTRAIPKSGVVAASGGNHGVAVAFAAHKLGVAAKIFVPNITSPAKLERLRQLEADVALVGESYDDALAASQIWTAESGALPIHAYDQVETLLGQGTVGLEFEEQSNSLDTLLVAVGGGGLIGGMAAWYRGRVKLIGVEPVAAPTLFKALAAGKPVDAEAGGIAADSLAPRRVGALMFGFAQQYIDSSVLVTDHQIQSSQRTLWNTLRIAAEPGGAAAIAALLSGVYVPKAGERVGVLICGGNTNSVNFA
jgi:threonine dehydratase